MPIKQSTAGRVAVGLLVAVVVGGSIWSARTMQATLTETAQLALTDANMGAEVRYDGLDAHLSLPDGDDAQVDAARDTVASVPGTRSVTVDGAEPTAKPSSSPAGQDTSSPSATEGQPSDPNSAEATATTASPSPVAPSPTPSTSPPVASPSPSPSPSPQPTEVEPIELPVITFAGGSATVDANQVGKLEPLAAWLTRNPQVRLLVRGHTDSGQDEAGRMTLSRERAAAIINHLQALGVDPARFTVATLGDKAPVASNATRAGRAKNRRVDFAIQEG